MVRFKVLLIDGAIILDISVCVTRPIPMTSIGCASLVKSSSSKLPMRYPCRLLSIVFWNMLVLFVLTNWFLVCLKSNPSLVVSSSALSMF